MNQYEIAVLYHPDLEIDMDKATAKVEKIFTDNGGKVVNTDNWGKRKLAYTIAKQEHAIYVIYTVEMPGSGIAKTEYSLNITDEVIRFLITRPDLKAIAKAEAIKAEKAQKAAERGDRGDDDRDRDSDKDD
jgi:small subunit ribosomal protein S6